MKSATNITMLSTRSLLICLSRLSLFSARARSKEHLPLIYSLTISSIFGSSATRLSFNRATLLIIEFKYSVLNWKLSFEFHPVISILRGLLIKQKLYTNLYTHLHMHFTLTKIAKTYRLLNRRLFGRLNTVVRARELVERYCEA